MNVRLSAVLIAILLSACIISACGDTSSQGGGNSGNNGLTTGGDLIAESQKTRQDLRDSIDNAQAVLNAPPVEKRTSDQVMGKSEEYSVPDYAHMTSDDDVTEHDGTEHDELSDLMSLQQDNEERRRSTPKDIKAKENAVLLDEDGLKITYKGLDADFLGHTIRLKLLIENNTSEARMIQIRDEAINGYMCDGSFSPEVNAGMKANDEIAFYDLPDEVGITSKNEIKNIVFAFTVCDPDHITEAKIYNPINLVF